MCPNRKFSLDRPPLGEVLRLINVQYNTSSTIMQLYTVDWTPDENEVIGKVFMRSDTPLHGYREIPGASLQTDRFYDMVRYEEYSGEPCIQKTATSFPY